MLAVAAGAAGVIVLMPEGEGARPEVLRPAPSMPVEREIKLTAPMRHAIEATIAGFVPAAVGRRDPALAWQLAGPSLRAGTSRTEWLRGSLPVFPFPYRDSRLRGWKPLYTYSDRVGFDLLLQPRPGAKKGPIAVKVEMVHGRGRWLVDTWYPAAVWSAPDERPWIAGPPDYAAGGSTAEWYNHEPTTKGRLDATWLFVPAGILGLVVVAPIALAGAGRLRRRAST